MMPTKFFKRAGHAGFHVGLELGDIQDYIGAQYRIADRVACAPR